MNATGTARKYSPATWLIKEAEDYHPPTETSVPTIPDSERIHRSLLALIGHQLRLVREMTGDDHPALNELASHHWKLQQLLWEKLKLVDYNLALAAVIPAEALPLETQCRFVAAAGTNIDLGPSLSERP